MPVVRPCIERLPDGRGCPEYAYDGPRCPEHTGEAMRDGTRSPGTTPAWSRARKLALERAGHRCERCGKTDAQSRAEGKGGHGKKGKRESVSVRFKAKRTSTRARNG